jgi:hypothetical protein
MSNYTNPLEAFLKLRLRHREWWRSSPRGECHPRPWPPEFDPGRRGTKVKVFAHNEVLVPRPPQETFDALVHAAAWPSYYPNARKVRLPDGKERLEAQMLFTWTTFGTTQKSTVREFEPGKALAWLAQSPGTDAYHRWILEPVDGATRLITEETQTGLVAALDRWIMNPGLHAAHQLWLERLKAKLSPS